MKKVNSDKLKELTEEQKSFVKLYLNDIEDMVIDNLIDISIHLSKDDKLPTMSLLPILNEIVLTGLKKANIRNNVSKIIDNAIKSIKRDYDKTFVDKVINNKPIVVVYVKDKKEMIEMAKKIVSRNKQFIKGLEAVPIGVELVEDDKIIHRDGITLQLKEMIVEFKVDIDS